jgi:glycosyltransferase involved in cell wall biosynthesis
MLILLDCRPLQWTGAESEKNRLIAATLAALSPSPDKGIEWVFVVDHSYRPGLFPELSGLLKDRPGVRLVSIRSFPGALGWKLWYDRQIPRLIGKYRPGLVMLTGGVTVKAAVVPQVVWMPVDADPKKGAAQPLYVSRVGESLRRAAVVLCFSEKDRAWVAARRSVDAGDIFVVRPGPSSVVTQLSVDEKTQLKQRYTQGKEYFFTEAAGAREDEIVQLLKAFSLFKKRQLSNLRLMIAGKLTAGLRVKLGTYKYREDVQWVDPDKGDEVMAGAYAALLPWDEGGLGAGLLNAWKAGVPVLAADDNRLGEMAGDAVLSAGISDPTALAGQMMSVYKDEGLRNTLVERGASRLTDFDPPPVLDELRAVLVRHNQIIK